MRKTKRNSPSGGDRREVVSPDGVLVFVLKKASAGVHVERRQQVKHGARTGVASVLTLFANELAFVRFCESDALRFEYPLTYAQLLREFDDLLDHSA